MNDELLDELKSDVNVKDMSESHITNSEKTKIKWNKFKKSRDWMLTPFEVVIFLILIFAAYLMGLSIYSLTGSLFLAIIAPAFTEGALFAAHLANDRAKNSPRQKELSRKLRWWQVGVSFVLLVLNLIVDTAKEVVQGSESFLNVDNVQYLIFIILGIDFMVLIVTFFKFKDADDEAIIKGEFAKRIENIKNNSLRDKMDAISEMEELKAKKRSEFIRKLAPQLVEKEAKIEAAKEINDLYISKGLTPEKVAELLKGVGFEDEKIDYEDSETMEEENKTGKRNYIRSGKYKKTSFPNGETNQTSQQEPVKTTPQLTEQEKEILRKDNSFKE